MELSFGTDARNRLGEATTPGRAGVLAALESFYYALNNRDLPALSAVWSDDPTTQLNNPLGGILRGRTEITELYRRLFNSPARIQVRFGDIVTYLDAQHAVFAGREIGTFVGANGDSLPLAIRTSRYFRYAAGRWSQWHHHGSIDDPAALHAYQSAVNGGAGPNGPASPMS